MSPLCDSSAAFARVTVRCGLAVILWAVSSDASPGQTPRTFSQLHQQCWDLIYEGKYAEAEPLAQRLCQWADQRAANEPSQWIDASNTLGDIYRCLARYEEAEPLYRRALETARSRLGEQDPKVAQSLHKLALLSYAQGRYGEAEEHYRLALEIYQSAGDPVPELVADLKNNLALVYQVQGRYAEAEPLHQQALEIRRERFGDRSTDVADSLNNLAELYQEQTRYTEAEALHRQVLEIRRKLLDDGHPSMASTYFSLADVYRKRRDYSQADRYFRKALEIRRKVFGDRHPVTAESLTSLARVLDHQGQHAEAEPLYREALEVSRQTLGNGHPEVARSLTHLAESYLNQGRFGEAEPLLDAALQIARRGVCEPRVAAFVHWCRGHVYWQTDRRQQAVEALEEAIQAIEWQRTHISGGEWQRAEFLGYWRSLYELMVDWQYELGRPAEAIRTIERPRTQTLLDQMQTAGLDLLAGLPEQQAKRLRQQETKAAEGVAELRRRLFEFWTDAAATRRERSPQGAVPEEQGLLNDLQQAQAEYARAYAEIRTASPAYRLTIRDDRQPVTVEKLKQWVDDQRALLLLYAFGHDGGYVLVLPAGGEPQLTRLAVSDQQGEVLGVPAGPLSAQRVHAVLTRGDGTGVLEHLRNSHDPHREQRAAEGLAMLWETLVPAVQREAILRGEFERLVVLPDGALALLPFETLVVELGDEPGYLLDVGPPVLIAPSATVLINLAERQADAERIAEQPVLSIGDCRYGMPEGQAAAGTYASGSTPQAALAGLFLPLKYAAWELEWVGEVFCEQGTRVAQLRGDAARESMVRQHVAGRRILHFSTHALVDQSHGNLFGALALTPGDSPDDPADDGFLTLAEVYGLDLAGCELTILGACETHVGPQQCGEGVWALSRGFLAAGARRVVASTWLLDDAVAASMISYFCGGVAKQDASEGQVDYARALHEAKRWTRGVRAEGRNWRSPYYWAPMVLVGPP